MVFKLNFESYLLKNTTKYESITTVRIFFKVSESSEFSEKLCRLVGI